MGQLHDIHKPKNTDYCVLYIQQLPGRFVFTRESHRWNASSAQSERLSEKSAALMDKSNLTRCLYESLAHLHRLDAIAYDCTNSDVGDAWETILEGLRGYCEAKLRHTVSVVLCLNPLDVSGHAVETATRLDSVPHAVTGIRVNIVYAPPCDSTTNRPIVQYLLHPQSRYITGSVIDSTGKILLGGMLNAERVLASRIPVDER